MHILESVEAWIRFLGVLLSALVGVIITDYYVVRPKLQRAEYPGREKLVNWSLVIMRPATTGSTPTEEAR